MNNFELHEKAQELADTKTPYALARELLLLSEATAKIKADAFREVGEVLKYEYEGWYDQSSIEDFFDEYANKLEKGEL